MKKKLLLVGLLGMLSTGAFAFSGEAGMSLESYTYHNGGTNSNQFIPGVNVKLNPITDSKFYVGGAFTKRAYTHDDKRITDQRERTDVYLGQDFKFGNLTLKPKFQMRNESFADGTYKNMQEYRFYPSMAYKINDKSSVFLSGYSALRRQKKDGARTYDYSSDTGRRTYNDYHHEYELGTSYKVTNNGTGTVSIWNEVYDYKDDQAQSETQLRFAYKQKFAEKFSVTPYMRISLQRDRIMKDKDSSVVSRNQRDRFGLKADYQVSPTFKLYAEVYAQVQRKDYDDFDSKTSTVTSAKLEERLIEQYVKVGFTQKF